MRACESGLRQLFSSMRVKCLLPFLVRGPDEVSVIPSVVQLERSGWSLEGDGHWNAGIYHGCGREGASNYCT